MSTLLCGAAVDYARAMAALPYELADERQAGSNANLLCFCASIQLEMKFIAEAVRVFGRPQPVTAACMPLVSRRNAFLVHERRRLSSEAR